MCVLRRPRPSVRAKECKKTLISIVRGGKKGNIVRGKKKGKDVCVLRRPRPSVRSQGMQKDVNK